MKSLLGISALVLLTAGAAVAQNAPNPNLPSLHGEISLRAGFTPDPHDVRVNTGGPIDASAVGNGCRGQVSEAPTIRVNWSAGSGSLPLLFTTTDYERDPVILVRDPSGQWHCDDDGGIGLNPLHEAQSSVSGRYDIWVGTYSGVSSSGVTSSATFRVTELSRHATEPEYVAPPVSSGPTATPRASLTGAPPNHHLSPQFGVINLSADFTPDPYNLTVMAGGDIQVSNFASGCAGYISAAPTARLNWRAGSGSGSGSLPLLVSSHADIDTTLLVRGPDGSWYCNDDGAGNFNPLFIAAPPVSGQYDIWVGRFRHGTTQATLKISELIRNVTTYHSSSWIDDDDAYCDDVDWADPYCWY